MDFQTHNILELSWLLATTGLSLHPGLLQPEGGGGVLIHHEGGGLVLAQLLQVALVSSAFSVIKPRLDGKGSAGAG